MAYRVIWERFDRSGQDWKRQNAWIFTSYPSSDEREREHILALVVAPTRELAIQIDAECKKYALAGSNSMCVYGGVPIHTQIAALRKQKPCLIVATPGRLCDLVKRDVSL